MYLVRHGQSTWNRDRLVQGQTTHPPLTALGRRQAVGARDAIASDLGDRRVDVYASSDQQRARQTAAVLAGSRPVILDRRLRERHAGRIQGLASAAATAAVEGFDWRDPDARFGGGESARDVHARVAPVLAEYDRRTAVLVSHGDTIRIALGLWCGHGPGAEPWVPVGSAAVFALDRPGMFREVIAGTSPPA